MSSTISGSGGILPSISPSAASIVACASGGIETRGSGHAGSPARARFGGALDERVEGPPPVDRRHVLIARQVPDVVAGATEEIDRLRAVAIRLSS